MGKKSETKQGKRREKGGKHQRKKKKKQQNTKCYLTLERGRGEKEQKVGRVREAKQEAN